MADQRSIIAGADLPSPGLAKSEEKVQVSCMCQLITVIGSAHAEHSSKVNDMTKIDAIAGGQEVIVMLRLKFRPGSIDHVVSTIVPIAKLTRKEEGNIEFHVYRARDEDDCLVIFERWANQAALELHWQEDYTKVVLALFEEHLLRPLSQAEDVTYLTDMLAHSVEH